MDLNAKKIFKTLNPNKVWIPILFGISIVFYLFYSDENIRISDFKMILDADKWAFLLAILLIMGRDVGYIYRIRVISGKELSWTSCFYVVILWEFASAVTPSVVGGTAVAVFILLKEGINLGKSLSYVMLTAILDNLFFVIVAPLSLLIVQNQIFPDLSDSSNLSGSGFVTEGGLQVLFYLSYSLIALYTMVMSYALFIKPRAFKWFLLKVTTIRFLRKWRYNAYEHGNEIIWASNHLKGKDISFWSKISLSTIFIWTMRYLQLNVLISAFASVNLLDNVVIFGRQVIMWIIMLISPTPGSSGTAEFFFPSFFEEFLGSYTFVTNIFWRMLSYYPYLLLGAVFLPRWIRRVFFKNKKADSEE